MWTALIVGIVVLVSGNVFVTRRLWQSGLYERSQKIAQTALLWLVPGGAIFVNRIMQGDRQDARGDDPTGPHPAGPSVGWDTPPSHGHPGDGHGL